MNTEIVSSSFEYNSEEIRSIIVNNIEYFNIVQVARFVKETKHPINSAQDFLKRHYDDIKNDIIVLDGGRPILFEVLLQTQSRAIARENTRGAFISFKGIDKWLMLSRGNKGREFRDALADHIEEHRTGKVIEIKTPDNPLELGKILNQQLALAFEAIEKQALEIQETKQLAQEAISRTEHITKGEFWSLYHMIKKLKDMGDKYIWRDVERVFRISNLGQLPASEFQTCIEFLKEREEALFKNQHKLTKFIER